MHLGSAAEPLEALLNQYAQDLSLRLKRHVGDLVDIYRAVMRLFQRADLARSGACALLGAEQLELHAVRHHSGGVQHDERPVGAERFRVHHPGRELLAAARGSGDQHPAIGRRNLVDRLAELIDGGRLADHLE